MRLLAITMVPLTPLVLQRHTVFMSRYKRKNSEFNQRLAHRRDTLLLAQLSTLLDACNTVMHTQESDEQRNEREYEQEGL